METEAIHVRLDQDIKTGLAAAAAADQRTLSNLVKLILKEWLENNQRNK